MIRAVVKNGTIQPIDPIPADWSEGREVIVQDAEKCSGPDDIDRWYMELEAIASNVDPEDDRRMDDAVCELRREAKEQARREMGSI